jgi:ribonuclease HI
MKKSPSRIKQNAEIFKDIGDLIRHNKLTVHFEKVIGHSGDVNNERADKLATRLAGKG